MTEEHKRKILEGRQRALAERKALGLPPRNPKKKKEVVTNYQNGLPVVRCSGKEENAFNFFLPLRYALRPAKLNELCKKIEREIANSVYWENVEWIKSIISKYAVLKVDPTVLKEIKKEWGYKTLLFKK